VNAEGEEGVLERRAVPLGDEPADEAFVRALLRGDGGDLGQRGDARGLGDEAVLGEVPDRLDGDVEVMVTAVTVASPERERAAERRRASRVADGVARRRRRRCGPAE
jgi:hypothetical protein